MHSIYILVLSRVLFLSVNTKFFMEKRKYGKMGKRVSIEALTEKDQSNKCHHTNETSGDAHSFIDFFPLSCTLITSPCHLHVCCKYMNNLTVQVCFGLNEFLCAYHFHVYVLKLENLHRHENVKVLITTCLAFSVNKTYCNIIF